MNSIIPKFKILIVDDNPKNIQVLGNILRKEGYNVEFAVNGKQALQRIEKESFDIILLDVMMPVMNGIEACKEIRNTHAPDELPIIFLTAKSERNDIVEGFNAGAQDYVVKPFDSQELLSRVNTHLDLKHKKEMLKQKNQELVEANALLTASEKKLKEMVATKDLFFSIIAHDLKTPFFVLSTHSQLLVNHIKKTQSITSDSKLLDTAQALNTVSKNGKSMLNNLLQWSMSQTGRLNFQPEEININSFIEHTIERLSPTAALKKISFFFNTTCSEIVYVDKNMLETIFNNLISNAIKFTPKHGKIEFSTTKQGDCVEVAIADTGVGIKPKDLENLFRIESKTKTIGTEGEEGSGLGLLLCKEFAETNGGSIVVESEVGKGSVFKITLPLAQQEN
jgi:signal transduction histidine kinase